MDTKKVLRAVLAAGLVASQIGAAQAQQLLAWPMGTVSILRSFLPGHPVMPIPPRPMPMPHPHPIPGPDPIPLPGPRPDPRPTPSPIAPPEASPITLSGYKVEGEIEDQVANLTFNITFHNPTNTRMEGVLLVPIPANTVLSGFQMTMGGKMVKGELLESGQATTIYENIVRSQRDPGLLELVGERLFRARVFPIEPNADITVRLGLTEVLPKSGELASLNIPIRSAQMMQGQRSPASVALKLHTSKPIRALYSPSAGAKVRKTDEHHAEVTYEQSTTNPAEDLNLFYSMQEDPLAANLLTYREDGEDGYFMLTLAPRPKVDETNVTPKDIVFIVDRSGSMEEGGKMEQARKALAYCISKLTPRDRFGIVDFATDTNAFSDNLVSATPENKKRALRYVERLDAAGGTNIEGGLQEGLKLLSKAPGRMPMVFFMTDGLPTIGTTDMPALLRTASEKNKDLRARVFSFGLGTDVNTLFLDKLSASNRGAGDYVLPEENIENKVSALYQKVAKPAMTDVKLDWGSMDVVQVYPKQTEDLFYGSELVLMGRYKEHGAGKLGVTGRSGGHEARFEFPLELPKDAPRQAFLPRLWANQKVAAELDAIRLSGRPADPEVVKDIIKLAKRHGIVTPYTSYLITEEGTDLTRMRNEGRRRFDALSANAAASGMSGGATMFRGAAKASRQLAAMRGSVAPSAMAMSPAFEAVSAGGAGAAFDSAEKDARQELKMEGTRTVQTRSIAEKTFYLRGGTWVDGDWELTEDKASVKTVKIVYLSPEYFELIHRRALARYLSVGENVKLLDNGTLYEVVAF